MYTLNPTTGAATVVGSNSGPYPGGLVYNPVSDILYVLEAGTDQMYTVDRATGATTYAFGGSFYVNDNGVAYDPNTNSYWVASWNSALLPLRRDFQLAGDLQLLESARWNRLCRRVYRHAGAGNASAAGRRSGDGRALAPPPAGVAVTTPNPPDLAEHGEAE